MTQKTIKKRLVKPLIQGGERREAGEVVTLRPDQVERLASEGYFNEAGTASQPQRGKQT